MDIFCWQIEDKFCYCGKTKKKLINLKREIIRDPWIQKKFKDGTYQEMQIFYEEDDD